MSDYSRRSEHNLPSSTSTSVSETPAFEQVQGNAAVQEQMKVEGALGRTFNRIAGVNEGNKDPTNLHFERSDLKTYLDEQLNLALGEFFRKAKINGVADKIMETLDANKDGKVTWVEFQVMVDEMRQHLIGDVGSNASTSEIEKKAHHLYMQISGGEGSIGFDTLESATLEQLPADQDHKSLVAQLAALMVLDIVDLDEGGKDVRERTIGEHEWMSAVNDFTKG